MAQEELSGVGSLMELRHTRVFLSHKHGDREDIDAVSAVLRECEVDVYADTSDPMIADAPSGHTAMRLKEKIKECDKFVLIVSDNVKASPWCNWELGYADGTGFDKILLFPVQIDEFHDLSGNEFFQIYPHIEITSEGRLVVISPDGSVPIPLSRWLNLDAR